MCAHERMIKGSGVSGHFSPVPLARLLSPGEQLFYHSFFLNSHPHSRKLQGGPGAPGCPGSPHRRTVLLQEDWLSLKQLGCSSWHHEEILKSTRLALSHGKMVRNCRLQAPALGVCLLRGTPPRVKRLPWTLLRPPNSYAETLPTMRWNLEMRSLGEMRVC